MITIPIITVVLFVEAFYKKKVLVIIKGDDYDYLYATGDERASYLIYLKRQWLYCHDIPLFLYAVFCSMQKYINNHRAFLKLGQSIACHHNLRKKVLINKLPPVKLISLCQKNTPPVLISWGDRGDSSAKKKQLMRNRHFVLRNACINVCLFHKDLLLRYHKYYPTEWSELLM